MVLIVKQFQKAVFENYMTNLSVKEKSYSKKRFKAAEGIYSTNFNRYLPKNKNAKILEIGCGRGIFINYLITKGYTHIEGVDLSKEQTAFCKNNIFPTVVLGDGFKYLKKSKTKYDLIVMHQVIEHIPKDELIESIRLIYDHLNNKGRLYLTTPNMDNFCMLRARYIDLTHEIGFTSDSLKALLKIVGFKKIITENFNFSRYSIKGLLGRIPQMIVFGLIWLLYLAQGLWLPKVMTKSIQCIAFKN